MKRKYLIQQSSNIHRLKNAEFIAKFKSLKRMCHILNSNGIEFAISYSGNLFFSGIVTTFNDIDIAIHYNGDIEKFKEMLRQNNIFINYQKNSRQVLFPTNLFLNCTCDGVQIEIYNVDFEVSKFRKVELYGEVVSLMPLELMFIQYAKLEEFQSETRKYKRILIEEYLYENGIDYPHFLEDALDNESVSLWIRIKCSQLLGKTKKRE